MAGGDDDSDGARGCASTGPAGDRGVVLDDDDHNFYGALQRLCVRSLSIRDYLTELKEKHKIEKESERILALSALLSLRQNRIASNAKEIESQLGEIQHTLKKKPSLNSDWGWDLERIKSGFESVNAISKKMASLEPPADKTAADADELIREVDQMDLALQEMVLRSSRITMPARVMDVLKGVRVGHSIDFHTLFVDELKEEADRKRILEWLSRSDSSEIANGALDAETGKIVRIEEDPRLRKKSLYHVITLMLLPLATLALALLYIRYLGPLISMPVAADAETVKIYAETVQKYILGYTALGMGAVAHVAFQFLKQYRKDRKIQFQTLDDIYLWANVKEMSLLLEAATIIAVFIFAIAFSDGVGWQTAFLFGYSYDSFFDTFALRFEAVVSEKTEALKPKEEAKPS